MAGIYGGLQFSTRLEAQWAAFFDLAGWTWRYNPTALEDWRPDFVVSIPCGHSECNDMHTLLVSVLDVASVAQLSTHPALRHSYRVQFDGDSFRADAGALFGNTPSASSWTMSHGAGGGTYDVPYWVDDADRLWRQAAENVA